ncbi:MAG TPA: replicative DNA helicase [bacterium]|uniref:Replicative DNA helicase n=1 Tax=candidate division TA06 bacterium ADurb.Bin417 TaxID=1852828 RepID=A0A1V5MJR2_UNCT6|nr:MAG: Replicative DNA helicase [candidate division TA06 bacterium ADurb.Bin417]HNQ34508.1 replicative DNA helicase [bacterium]HNS48046.1 replicative DNA helicase [bacterium]
MGSTSLDLLEERVPPNNLEAEMALLGSMLLSDDARLQAIETVRAEHFYKKSHAQIFESIVRLAEANEPCDLVTLTDSLTRQKALKDLGGPAYLASLIDLVPTPANIGQYIKIVREHFIRRTLIESCSQIIGKSYHLAEDIEQLMDESERAIFQISERQQSDRIIPMRELVHQNFEAISRLYQNREYLTGVATGFEKLDTVTGGFQNSDLIVLASRPSMGKTSLACSMVRYQVVDKKLPAAFFSLEMSRDQIVQRLLCSEARVNLSNLRRGYAQHSDIPQLTLAAGKLSEAPLYIDDSPGMSALEIRAKSRRLVARHQIKIVYIDYLQLIRSRTRFDNRQQEISEISAGLKSLAKELNIPVVAISQLSREVEKRDNKRPQLSDLRESGSIEQDADVVLLMVRPEFYNPVPENEGLAELIVAKQRNGPTDNFNLTFIKQYTRFENCAEREETAS